MSCQKHSRIIEHTNPINTEFNRSGTDPVAIPCISVYIAGLLVDPSDAIYGALKGKRAAYLDVS